MWGENVTDAATSKRRRGRPKRRYMDGLNEDMNVAGVTVKIQVTGKVGEKQFALATPNRDKPN